jgi:hypothetical protein
LLDERNQTADKEVRSHRRTVRNEDGVDRSVTIEKIDDISIPVDELTAIEACFAALVDAALTQAKRERDTVVESSRSSNVPEETAVSGTTG